MKNKVLYAHYRESDGEIFYVGIGTPKRPYSKNRGEHWHNVVNKHGYFVKILKENLSTDEAIQLEIETIKLYGRKENNEGPLINQTDGGDGGNGKKGKNHYEYDHTLYKFKKDDLIVESTRFEFYQKYNLSRIQVMKMTKGKGASCGGWICLNPDKEFKPKQKTIFEFIHKDGTKEKCTQLELRNKYDLHAGALSALVNGKVKSHKGWKILIK